MDYTILAQDELRLLPQLESALASVNTEIEDLELEMRAVKGSSAFRDLPRGGATPEDRLVALISRKDDLLIRRKQLKLRLKRLRDALGSINFLQKEAIFRLYAKNHRAEDIIGDLNIEKSTFYRLRSESIENFTRALYGVVKT